jgi:hypothetical protein
MEQLLEQGVEPREAARLDRIGQAAPQLDLAADRKRANGRRKKPRKSGV